MTDITLVQTIFKKSRPASMKTRICYTAQHIRPLAVSPLKHQESVPNPRGFLFSGTLVAGGVA